MKTERQIAELIFEMFRAGHCKTDHIVMTGTIRTLWVKLNPKEQEIFDIVFYGLEMQGYFSKLDCPDSIKLSQKGFDYIYDEMLITKMLNTPWVIPSRNNTDWNLAFNKLWKVIGPQNNAVCYIKGPEFYSIALQLTDKLPPSYVAYIDELRQNNLSTSRSDYYKNIINGFTENLRIKFYVEIQSLIENKLVFSQRDDEITDVSLSDMNRPSLKNVSQCVKNETHIHEKDEYEATKRPIVFISYSWDDKAHEYWVLNLATQLKTKFGIEIILDKWCLTFGEPITHFMEHAITDSHRVICVITPNYKKKTEKLEGGVGVEYSIISSELQKRIATDKFIPLFRRGDRNTDIPTFLEGRNYIDMRKDDDFDDKVKDLAMDLWGKSRYKIPQLGPKPVFE